MSSSIYGLARELLIRKRSIIPRMEVRQVKDMNSVQRWLLLFLTICMFALTGLPGWGLAFDGRGLGSKIAQEQEQQSAKPRTFTGTIVWDGEQYVLRVSSGGVYKLDDPRRARRFDGKAVNVTGQLDMETKLIHIYWIEADWA